MARNSDPEFRWYHAQLVRETEKAWLLRNSDDEENWYPKSQVKQLGTEKWLVPTWLLEKSGQMIYSEPVEHNTDQYDEDMRDF